MGIGHLRQLRSQHTNLFVTQQPNAIHETVFLEMNELLIRKQMAFPVCGFRRPGEKVSDRFVL